MHLCSVPNRKTRPKLVTTSAEMVAYGKSGCNRPSLVLHLTTPNKLKQTAYLQSYPTYPFRLPARRVP